MEKHMEMQWKLSLCSSSLDLCNVGANRITNIMVPSWGLRAVCVCVCVRVYVCVYIYIYVCIHTHMCIQICFRFQAQLLRSPQPCW